MAVNMNKRECVRRLVAVLVLFLGVIECTVAQAAQLDPSLLSGQCPCDLTGNSCDVNCCCDEDCTEADNRAFSSCLPFPVDEGDSVCLPEEVFLFENADNVRSETVNGFLCISSDNTADRNLYTDPDLVQTLATFREYQKEFPSFSPQSDPVTSAVSNATAYKSGEAIYTVFENQSLGKLGLPRPLTTADCLDSNAAAYLSDETFSCIRTVQDFSTECTTSPALNGNNFLTGFRVVKTPQLFQDFNITQNETGEAYNLYNNSYTVDVELDTGTGVDPILCLDSSGNTAPCGYSTLPSPSLVLTTCADVVKEVHYRITTNGSAGIVQALVRFVLTNISDPSNVGVSFTQSFSVAFDAFGRMTEKVELSGNPGYVVGQPVLAGTLNVTTDASGSATDRIEISPNRNRYMTLVRSSASGACVSGADNRVPVLFGENVQTGCMLGVTTTDLTQYCALMRQSIIEALEYDSIPEATPSGFRDNNRYVGIYGNSDPAETGNWVKILYQNRLLPSTASTLPSSCQLSLGMHIKILYANIGAIINPQPKIIGVSFVYDSPTTVQIRPSATGQFNQAVEISTSVSFVDVSKPAVGYEANPAIYHDKVPDDFLFPFSGASTPTPTLLGFLLSFTVLMMCQLL